MTGKKWDTLSLDDFVAIFSDHGFVGDPLVDTQHFIGGSRYEKASETEALGDHQLRAAHQRYTGPDKKTVEAKGHGHGLMRHYYKKLDGVWKLARLRPTSRWIEYNFEDIFKGH